MTTRRTLPGVAAIVPDADHPPGVALARSLGAAGSAIVCCGRDAAALGALAAELEEAGARAAVFVGDLADPSARDALVEMVAELFPGGREPA